MSNILRYQAWLNENLIVEADDLIINWKGKLTGPFNPTIIKGSKPILGIGQKKGERGAKALISGSAAKRGSIWGSVTPPKSTPPVSTKPQAAPTIITPSVDFKGTDFPYPDNIITPNWTVAQTAKVLFDGFITNLVAYFKLDATQAKNNFRSIAIEGAADIAPATTAIPSGYTQLDHNYGGAKPSNEFLAENRAIKMKEEIVKALTATGGLAPDLITFISDKITITFKTGLPRGGRYVKITTDAIPYNVTTPGKITPGTTTPGTETPGQVGPSGEISKTYSVLTDPMLEFFFGDASEYKIDSLAFRPDKNGQADFKALKLTDLQAWAKDYLGAELLSLAEVGNLTLTVEFNEKETPVRPRPGEVSAALVDYWTTVKFNNVPSGKVVVPVSDVAGNDANTIICSTENAEWLRNKGYGLRQDGVRAGFPFMLCYSTAGDGYAVLEMHNFAIGNEYTMTAGLPY
jgi:hypothetical protein